MQEVGQAPLGGVTFGLHAPANVLLVHHFVEHGQKALTLPRGVPSIEALDPDVPCCLVVDRLFNFSQA